MTDPAAANSHPPAGVLPRALARQSRARLFLILLAVILVFIEAFLFVQHDFPLIIGETDGIGYMERSSKLFQLERFHGPGYSWAIGAVRLFGFDPFPAAKLVSILCAVLLIPVLYRVLRTVSSPGQAVFSTYIVVLSPIFLIRGVTVMSDMMAFCLALWMLALLIPSAQLGWKRMLFAGILAALAYLTRYVYIFLIAVPVLLLLLRLPREGSLRRRLVHLAVFCAGFLLAAAPWFVFVSRQEGMPFYNLGQYSSIIAHVMRDKMAYYTPGSGGFESMLSILGSNPSLFVSNWLEDFRALPGRLLALFPEIGLLVAVGAIAWVWRMNRYKLALLLVTLLYSGIICVAWLFDRLLLFLLPLTASFLASAVFLVPRTIPAAAKLGRVGKLISRVPWRAMVMAALILMMAMHSGTHVSEFLSNHPDEYKAAADWLRTVSTEETTVLAAKPHIPYFGNAHHVEFRAQRLDRTRLPDLPRNLAKIRPTYIVYDNRYTLEKVPMLRALLDPKNQRIPKGLEAVFEVDSPRRLVVYRYNGSKK